MASHDVGIGDFVLLDEITVDRVVENLKTRCVTSSPGVSDGICSETPRRRES